MYAIIEDSGTQIKVSTGDVVEIDLRDASVGDTIKFDRVLFIGGGDAKGRIGTPYVEGSSVTAEVVAPTLGPKLTGVKYSRRKGYKVKKGHRQMHLRVKVGDIVGA